MQHRHVLKKLNFDLFSASQGCGGGGGGGGVGVVEKYVQPCGCISDSL